MDSKKRGLKPTLKKSQIFNSQIKKDVVIKRKQMTQTKKIGGKNERTLFTSTFKKK